MHLGKLCSKNRSHLNPPRGVQATQNKPNKNSEHVIANKSKNDREPPFKKRRKPIIVVRPRKAQPKRSKDSESDQQLLRQENAEEETLPKNVVKESVAKNAIPTGTSSILKSNKNSSRAHSQCCRMFKKGNIFENFDDFKQF